MPGSHDWSSAVAADRSGNIVVAGQTDGDLFRPAAGNGQDMWVSKLDGTGGDLVWGYQASFVGDSRMRRAWGRGQGRKDRTRARKKLETKCAPPRAPDPRPCG